MKQQGVTLFISLILLVTLTMLGLTSMQRTTTELAMAGNQKESDMTFQAAEVGLLSAETFILNSKSNADFDDATKGLFTVTETASVVDYFDGAQWQDGGGAQKAATTVGETLYKVEYLGDRYEDPNERMNFGSGYPGPSGKVVSVYRVTARGAGQTDRAFSYIQSYFGKEKIN